jgi:hypothetical protein
MTEAPQQPIQPPANTTPKPGGNRTITIVAAVAVPALALVAVVMFLRAGAYDVTIGVEGRRTVEIAGPELSAAPFTPGDAVSVRIADVQPLTAGYRYDLRYMAFGPGKHDLAPLLKRPDGSSPESRADLRITVAALLPEDYSGELYATPPAPIDLHTRYKYYMGAAWIAWGSLLVPLAWWGHKRRRRKVREAPPPSLVERVRTLLRQATEANLTIEEKADLEALLLAFWSQKLKLSEERLSATIEQLRRHPQAAAQWNRVERWIHSPSGTPTDAASKDRAATNRAVAKQLLSDFEAIN